MGRFRCTVCGREYYDKRFLWEELPPQSDSLQQNPSFAEVVNFLPEGTALEGKSFVDELRTYADAVRATGTMANVVGSTANSIGAAAGAVAAACAPISVLGGVVGTAGGASQLTQGLTMPSGEVDPHLVAKGGLTMGVGSTCIALGCCAAFAPSLFFVALGLGAAGVGTASILDATMSGLCCECRVKRPEDHKADDDAGLEWNKADDNAVLELNKADDDAALEWNKAMGREITSLGALRASTASTRSTLTTVASTCSAGSSSTSTLADYDEAPEWNKAVEFETADDNAPLEWDQAYDEQLQEQVYSGNTVLLAPRMSPPGQRNDGWRQEPPSSVASFF